jgi:hypothetical protein
MKKKTETFTVPEEPRICLSTVCNKILSNEEEVHCRLCGMLIEHKMTCQSFDLAAMSVKFHAAENRLWIETCMPL